MLVKIKRRIARELGVIPGYTRTIRHFKYRKSQLLAIPMYHGLVDKPLQCFNWCQLDVERFERQIQFLKSEYSVLPLREAVYRIRHGLTLPERATVITFDDGLRSVYTTAFPLLERYQLPFTVFLITGLVGGDEPAWPERLFVAISKTAERAVRFDNLEWPLSPEQRAHTYEAIVSRLKQMELSANAKALDQLIQDLRPAGGDETFALMNWTEIEQMARSELADFGSHTHTHPILSRCDEARQKFELSTSRDLLRQHLEHGDLFAYPNGTREDFSALTKQLLRDLEYSCALSTIEGINEPGSDLYELARVNVGADTSLSDFEVMMLGF